MVSIRENALAKICELFTDQREGQPTTDPYDFTWSLVQREPLGELASRKRYALAVLDTDEADHKQVQTVQVDLRVTLEFRSLLEVGEASSTCLNMMLENIYRRVRSDRRLTTVNGGTPLIIDMSPTANTVDVDSYADRMVEGAMFLLVKYKHSEDDMRVVVA